MAIPNQTGSGFTNIQNVLNANQSNSLGDAIKSGVQGQVNQFNNGLQAGQNQFNSDIDSAKSSIDLGKSQAQGSVNDASNLQGGQTLSDNDVTNYNNFTGSSYQGPTNLYNDDQLHSQANQIQNTAQQTQSDSGRQGLLQEYVGQGQYSQGQQNLDNLLLNKTGGQQLQDVRQMANPVPSELNTANSNAANQGQQMSNYLNTTQKDLQNKTSTGYQNIANAVNDKYSALTNSQTGDQAQYQNYLNTLNSNTGVPSGNLQISSKLGGILGLNQAQNIYGLNGQDLSSTLNFDGNDLTKAGITSADQYAQYQALSQLAGNQANIFNGTDPSQVGTYKGITANQAAVQNALQQAQQNYQNSYNNGTFSANKLEYGNGDLVNASAPTSWSIYGGITAPETLSQAQGEIAGLQTQMTGNPYGNPTWDQSQIGTLQGQINDYLSSIGTDRDVSFTDATQNPVVFKTVQKALGQS